MRRGFALPQIGSVAGPDALITVAKRAEALGFDSVWVLDRLLFPVEPRAPYLVGDGTLRAKYQRSLDLVETLTFVAAYTAAWPWARVS
jgi:alkanesulfonate monooxygenase SsuD/methylene tetrahydromethanopterin reductase-like flavin-dependent oxidoreductase (luciferase family)